MYYLNLFIFLFFCTEHHHPTNETEEEKRELLKILKLFHPFPPDVGRWWWLFRISWHSFSKFAIWFFVFYVANLLLIQRHDFVKYTNLTQVSMKAVTNVIFYCSKPLGRDSLKKYLNQRRYNLTRLELIRDNVIRIRTGIKTML